MPGCEYVDKEKGVLCRCNWYIKMTGKDPQSLKEYDEWGCAIAWQPVLGVEMSQSTRGVRSAVSSFRDEMVSGNNRLLDIFTAASLEHQEK